MKKLISIIMLVCILLSTYTIYAEETTSISYSNASQKLLQNNWNLKQLKNSQYQASKQYKDSAKSASEMSIDSIKEFYMIFLKTNLDSYKEMQLLKQRDLVPKQLQLNVAQAENNYNVTEKSIKNSLRSVYLSVLSTDLSAQISNKRLELELQKYNQIKLKFELGLIAQFDVEQSEYNYMKVQQQVKASLRNRDNAVRALNQFIGESIDTPYDLVKTDDRSEYKGLQPIDYYINSALEKRVEIPSIEGQIELKKLEMSIMEKNNVHIIYRVARHDYAKLKAEIETLKLKLEQTKIEMEKNIKNAYIDVQKDISTIKSLENTIESQQEQLNKLENQLEQGNINRLVVEEMKIGIMELKNNLLLAIYNCNTKVQRLENAASYGPAY